MRLKWFLMALVGVAVMADAQISTTLKQTVLSPGTSRQDSALEGKSVATDGDLIVTGVPGAIGAKFSEGVVHVYSATTGTLLHKLREPSPPDDARFGTAVAVSGSRVVVLNERSPKAYVYELSSPSPTVPAFVLTHPSVSFTDIPGRSVAIEGSRVFIGAPQGETGAIGSGCVYIFDLGGANPTSPVSTILDPTPTNFENFGKSVSASGDRLAVGAPQALNGPGWFGAVYIYDLGAGVPGAPVTEIRNPNTTQQTRFGASVSISGTRLAVGAYEEDFGAENAGGAFLYDLAGPTPTTPVSTLVSPQPGINNWYGYSVSVSGSRAIVGAIFTPLVGVYDFADANPANAKFTLVNPTPNTANYFGESVTISGSRVVIGAEGANIDGIDRTGCAYVYDLGSATPTAPVSTLSSPNPSSNDYFGVSTALSGGYMLLGAMYDGTGGNAAGAAYLYDLKSETPNSPHLSINNPNPSRYDYFGQALSISGERAVIGAYGDDDVGMDSGVAYIYDFSGANPAAPILTLPNPSPAQGDEFGRAVAISGSLVVVGAHLDDSEITDSGAVYVYDLSSATPATPVCVFKNPSPAAGTEFGSAVAVHGTRVVVGANSDDTAANNSGRVYIFDIATATPTAPIAVLSSPQPSFGQYFGVSVAIHGEFVTIGASGWSGNAGKAFVYDLSSATPTAPIATLDHPAPLSGDWFGASVAMVEGRIVVGAPGKFQNSIRAGTTYLYYLGGHGTESPVATLPNPRPSMQDNFGSSVAFDGRTIVVGAYLEDSPTVDKGAAYVFDSVDSLTQAPRVVAPAADSYNKAPVSISFRLFETAKPGSLMMNLKRGTTNYLLKLSDALGTPGTHTVTLDLQNPAQSTGVVSAQADSIPDGEYTATIIYNDLAGNPAIQPPLWTLTIDTTAPTLLPVNLFSSNGSLGWARDGNKVSLEFEASEAIKAPTVQIGGQNVAIMGGPRIWRGDLDVSSATLPEGPVSFAISYEDLAGNQGTAVTTTTNGSAVTVDRTPPVLNPPTGTTALAPDFSGVAVPYTITVTDNLDPLPQVSSTPASGSVFPLGGSTVTATTIDAAGNSATGEFDVTVYLENPLQTVLAVKGGAVPGAGAPDSKIPAGATWSMFGVPSVIGGTDENAIVGYLATVSSSSEAITGIFSGAEDAPAALVTTADAVTDGSGQTLPETTFASFRDPVFSGPDDFAFLATAAGNGITKANDTGIWSGGATGLREIAREGAAAPGLDSVSFGAFTSLLMPAPDKVFFVATLKGKKVTPKNDLSLWFWSAESGLQIVQREGSPSANPVFTETVKSFVALAPVTGSAGHGRYDSERVAALLKFANGSQALINLEGANVIDEEIVTGLELSPGVVASSFGMPSFVPGGYAYSVKAQLAPGGSWKKKTTAIVRDDIVIAAKGAAVPAAIFEGAKFSDFSDPISGVGAGDLRTELFLAKVTGSGIKGNNDQALWRYAGEGPNLAMVAREGAEAPGCDGATFKAFTAFSLMTHRGPLFAATLQGGTSALKRGTDTGLWGTDYAGTTRLLLRTGQVFGGRTLKAFDVLGVVSNSPAQQRAWAESVPATIIVHGFFTDRSQAVLKVTIP